MFGPFYPLRLQLAVDHSERTSQLLAAREARAHPPDEWAWAWLTGRASEIEQLVGYVTTAWRRGEVTEKDAAAAIERYLVVLHEGMRRRLNLVNPACCTGATALTVPSEPAPAPALVSAPAPAPTRRHGTVAQPSPSIDELLDGLLGPG